MSEAIRRIEPNPRMSAAVVHHGIVYLSGQVAIEQRGGSVAEQTGEILARIDALLAEAGTSRARLLTAQLFLADVSKLPELNTLWDAWLVPGAAPTRTTIQATLASPDYVVEIAVTAALDD